MQLLLLHAQQASKPEQARVSLHRLAMKLKCSHTIAHPTLDTGFT